MALLSGFNKFGEFLGSDTIENSLIDWLKENVPNYHDCHKDPYSAQLNGEPWPYSDHNRKLSETDRVTLTIEPQDPATALYIIAAIMVAYSYYVASNLPQGYQESTPDGQSIYSATSRVNSVKPNGIIREVAGTVPIYPDLICPVTRRYIDHEEFLYLNLCVGMGEFDLALENIYIDQTPATNYSGDVDIQISGPGDDVSGHESFENWYQTSEVLDLELIQAPEIASGQWSITTTSDTVTTKLDGVVTAFPYGVDVIVSIFDLDNNSINSGGGGNKFYRVSAISGSIGQTATLVLSDVVGGAVVDDPPTSLASLTDEDVLIKGREGVENWEGPFELVPEGETTNTIEFDVNFPGGLVNLQDGEETLRIVEIDVQYREVGTTTWQLLPSPNNVSVFTESTLNERGYTGRLNITSGRHEIRFRRVTTDAKYTNIIDKVVIKRVRCLLESPTSYDDVTTIQIKIRGTNALAQSAENKINIKDAARKLPTLANLEDHIDNDTALVLFDTNSIMRFVGWHMFQSADTALIDFNSFYSLNTLLESRGDELNMEFADETTLWEALKIMLAPGYCEPTIKAGLLTPVRIAATTDYNYIYTPDNLLGNGVSRIDTHPIETESQGVIVEYLNPTTKTMDSVECFLPGDTAFKSKRVQVQGITDRTRAWRYGMRERRRMALKPATYTFTTELDALNSDYGSADALVSPLDANQSFFVTGTTDAVIHLDGPADVDDSGDYKAVFKTTTGEMSGVYTVISAPGGDIELDSPTSLDFTPKFDSSMESTVVSIGKIDELLQRIIVRAIEPSGTDTVKVTAEEYLAELYDDDDNAPS